MAQPSRRKSSQGSHHHSWDRTVTGWGSQKQRGKESVLPAVSSILPRVRHFCQTQGKRSQGMYPEFLMKITSSTHGLWERCVQGWRQWPCSQDLWQSQAGALLPQPSLSLSGSHLSELTELKAQTPAAAALDLLWSLDAATERPGVVCGEGKAGGAHIPHLWIWWNYEQRLSPQWDNSCSKNSSGSWKGRSDLFEVLALHPSPSNYYNDKRAQWALVTTLSSFRKTEGVFMNCRWRFNKGSTWDGQGSRLEARIWPRGPGPERTEMPQEGNKVTHRIEKLSRSQPPGPASWNFYIFLLLYHTFFAQIVNIF